MLYKDFEGKKPAAVNANEWPGNFVLFDVNDEEVVSAYYKGDGVYEKFLTNKVYVSTSPKDDSFYFIRNGRKYDLDTFIRVGTPWFPDFDTCEKVEDTSLMFLFFPEKSLYVKIEEGIGDNLLREDIEEGYVDYINYSTYKLDAENDPPEFVDEDGGMVLLKKYYSELSMGSIITAICNDLEIPNRNYQILH